MKKFYLPLFVSMIFVSGNAWATGAVGRLESKTNCSSANEYYWVGGGKCVECDEGASDRNAPRGTYAYHYYSEDNIKYAKCNITGSDDYWSGRVSIYKCTNNVCPSGTMELSMPGTTVYKLCKSGGTNYQQIGDSVFTNGYISCYVNKTLQQQQNANKKQKCEQSGGVIRNNTCWCDTTATGLISKDSTQQECKCQDTSKTYNATTKKCEAESNGGGNGGGNSGGGGNGGGGTTVVYVGGGGNGGGGSSAKSTACVNSGGTFANNTCSCDANKNMEVSNGTCICKAGYEWVAAGTPSQGCKITNTEIIRRACDAATNADWNATTQKCVCKDADYVLDVDAQTCKPIAALAECQPLMSNNKARWDATSKTCSCTQAGYEIVNGDCVETEAAATARKDKEMKSAKNKIEDVHSKLKRVQDGFKVSAWKNEEGKFNTARLASDSIAGVVLGTAGGLVTSKVVKKNQVENGFEDIQCTIGGQAVAQWGDDFSVGTQF